MKTIFFDWGGVLADDPGDDFLEKLLVDIGATPAQIKEIFGTYMKRFMRGQISEAEYWHELRKNYGLTIHDSISEEFKKWSGLAANPDVLALVEEARSSGWQTALLSNVIEPTYNVLSAAGFYSKFDALIASCKEGYAKPDREIYELALERLHTAAHESVFVDDKEKNLEPARQLGFRTILAESPQQIVRDVRAIL